MDNREYCQSIAEEIEAIVNGEVLDDDGEPVTLYDYFRDALDIEYTIRSDCSYRGVKIMVTCGGPNVYVNTNTRRVELYWWNESAEYMLLSDAVEAIDEMFEELYECSR